MHDAALVQIANGLQNLLDHTAGVLLRVDASVQNTVKKLPTGNSESRNRSLILFLDDENEIAKMENSQLHDEIVVGPTLIELLHPHNVLVLDPGVQNKMKHNTCVWLLPSISLKHISLNREEIAPSQHSDLVLQVEIPLLFLLHALHGKHLSRLLLLHHVHL